MQRFKKILMSRRDQVQGGTKTELTKVILTCFLFTNFQVKFLVIKSKKSLGTKTGLGRKKGRKKGHEYGNLFS